MIVEIVAQVGVEPTIPKAADFKSAAYPSSATGPSNYIITNIPSSVNKSFRNLDIRLFLDRIIENILLEIHDLHLDLQ